MTTPEIIDALTNYSNIFPREALSEAPQHKEELIPLLLGALDYVCDNADNLIKEKSPYDLHFYASFLLAQFREKQAFPKLIRLLRNNEEILDYFLGDTVTSGINRCLNSVYDGNIGLMRELIEDTNAYEYARNAAVQAYGYIARNDPAVHAGMIEYFRCFIHERLKDDTSYIPTSVSAMIMEEHLFELIPDVKFLYDLGLVDHFSHGPYDSFLDYIFDYTKRPDNIFIDDVVGELQHWAKYDDDPTIPPKPAPPAKKIPAARPPEEKPQVITKKKIGRNDPCPCGSGKKYKKCCLPLGIKFDNKEENEVPSLGTIKSYPKELRKLYDSSQPYDLMQDYPRQGTPLAEGQRIITEFYSQKAIEIDIPVYKALHHRSIPLWVRRDRGREDIGRIDFLLKAFTMFTQICAEEQLETFAAFDRKYMVHYESASWVAVLCDLLEEYEDDISVEKSAALESVKAAIERMR